MSKVLKNLRYSADHEWITDDSPAKVGLTQVAVDALGDIVYIDLPAEGDTVTAGEACGEVESTKSVSDLISPVSGTIVEVNQSVIDEPSSLNSDPYGDAWMFTVEVDSEGPLLSAEEYATANSAEVIDG